MLQGCVKGILTHLMKGCQFNFFDYKIGTKKNPQKCEYSQRTSGNTQYVCRQRKSSYRIFHCLVTQNAVIEQTHTVH